MRQYASPAALRAAIDARLRKLAGDLGVEAFILRRQAALERLMARLAQVASGRWAFKGGLALQIRLHEHGRHSLDLDADHAQGTEAAREDLQRAATLDLGDGFAFAITGVEDLREEDLRLAVRYGLQSLVGGAPFAARRHDVAVFVDGDDHRDVGVSLGGSHSKRNGLRADGDPPNTGLQMHGCK